ncbi:MAG: hypothetical protein JSU67_17010 [Gammaproteobacteria bacterium]|nr:MAG: hypothetical protein JSU67_17010 [Gammaproteobacteria bacterium]
MKALIPLPFLLLLTLPGAASAIAADEPVTQKRQFMSVNVDRVVIDTEGLTRASVRLAESIDELALALNKLSTDSEALSEEEKQVLLQAVASVERASNALEKLAIELPQTGQQLSRQIPQVVENARQPIAELSSGLQSARDGIYAITESLPQATDNAKDLVNSALDSALVKISTYTVILISVLALALIGVVWFIYRQYLAPIAAKLEPLAVAPEHFAELSRHMKETSDNLLTLQTAVAAERLPATGTPKPDQGSR